MKVSLKKLAGRSDFFLHNLENCAIMSAIILFIMVLSKKAQAQSEKISQHLRAIEEDLIKAMREGWKSQSVASETFSDISF